MNDQLPRVLIVDDEERIRRLLLEYFEDYGEFRLVATESGEAALQALAEEPADLCVVDMRLPGMNGEAFILAAGERRLCRRFLVHTGSVDLSLSEGLRRLGITEKDVFFKPSDVERILGRVREIMEGGE
ncbi:MAG TPA: response regulator [Desulfovibrio sp.]|jgi:DNA-binding NtrC family response regulator|uniref:response regulator n=1 Tax=Desulfovibrio TaxID=872 RepID=UPI002A40B697|nr:response regulator [Desulfovibrio sp.]MDY0306151.1 response regulator [Desulfovibrionaceae bacterium]HMM39143.1 response regulator [Desulfovibrio sp.]